jgi:hypothetical protein
MAKFLGITIMLVWAAGCAAQQALVVDRVAVVLGRQVISLSAVRRAVRMEALAAGRVPDDTPARRRAAAERLIDQAIFEREIQLGNFTAPALAEADTKVDDYLKERGITRAQLLAELARYGFSEDDLRHEMQWRLHVERFIEFRFTPGAQVSSSEIEDYYRREFLPQWKGPQAAPALDAVRARIERILAVRKTDEAMRQWLERMRASLRPRVFEAALDNPEALP